jgi:tripartite-type tricarboxylate transporter receptor subunit TctC
MEMKAMKLATVLSMAVLCQVGAAQSVFPQPGKVLTLVYPFGAGGTDALFRVFAENMSEVSGGKFIMMNREGASGAIGAGTVARAQPDGYTLMVGPSIVVTNLPYTQKDLTYTIDSFDFVCQMNVNVLTVVVKKDSPFKSFKDLVAAIHANPDKFNYGHSGTYTDFHLNMLQLQRQADLKLQDIAYRGDGPNLQALLAGDLDFTINSVVSVAQRSDVRPLAVFWDHRHPALPDTPSVAELGYSAFFTGFQGLFAPKGTPKPVLQKLSSMCEQAVQKESYRTAAAGQGTIVAYLNSEDFERATKASFGAKGKLFRELRVLPQ